MNHSQSHELKPVAATTKVDRIRQQLLALAHRLGPDAKLPTIRELCESMRVSNATLDRALGELERSGVLVRYRSRGIYVASELRQRTLALVFGRDPFRVGHSPFFSMFIDAAQRLAGQRDHQIQTYLDLPQVRGQSTARRQLATDIACGRVHGVLLLASSGPEQSTWLLEQDVPMIYAGAESAPGHRIANRFDELIAPAVRALADRGAKRIGYIAELRAELERRRGDPTFQRFRQAIQDAGLRFDERWCHRVRHEHEHWQSRVTPTYEEFGYEAARRILIQSEQDRPDALLVLDDMMTRGALTALHQAGLEPAGDVQIGTFAVKDSPALRPYGDRFVRIELDVDEFTTIALDQLERLMDGKQLKSRLRDVPCRLELPRA